jgi:SAM-dependent methyltransferase
MDPRKRIVAQGYDRMGQRYIEWSRGIRHDPRDRMVPLLTDWLPKGARVLELGCGAGIPSTRALARRFHVTGVDISQSQLAMARRNVPTADFTHADVSALEMPDDSFEGVVALYVISHLPREEHAELFSSVMHWLVPGGVFLATLGATDERGWTGEWLGEPMFFSSYDAATNRDLLRDAGFDLLIDETLVTREPDGDVSFPWVLAQKPRAEANAEGAVRDRRRPRGRRGRLGSCGVRDDQRTVAGRHDRRPTASASASRTAPSSAAEPSVTGSAVSGTSSDAAS